MKKEANKIEWKAIDDDDFIANVGDYCLRTEQMSKKHWWFTVYFRDEEIFIDIQSAFNEQQGKDLAEIYYKAHRIEREHNNMEKQLDVYLKQLHIADNDLQALKSKKHSNQIELLEKYSLFLEEHGYLDTDWRIEEPFAIDEFLNPNP